MRALSNAKHAYLWVNFELTKVSVQPDRTVAQRQHIKQLADQLATRRAEGETDMVIRNNRIQKFRNPAQRETWAKIHG